MRVTLTIWAGVLGSTSSFFASIMNGPPQIMPSLGTLDCPRRAAHKPFHRKYLCDAVPL